MVYHSTMGDLKQYETVFTRVLEGLEDPADYDAIAAMFVEEILNDYGPFREAVLVVLDVGGAEEGLEEVDYTITVLASPAFVEELTNTPYEFEERANVA